MTSDEKDYYLLEMMRFIEENGITSYYDLRAYAYNNNPEWISMFRDKSIRQILRSKLHKTSQSISAPVSRSKQDAMHALNEAKSRYFALKEAEERKKWDDM